MMQQLLGVTMMLSLFVAIQQIFIGSQATQSIDPKQRFLRESKDFVSSLRRSPSRQESISNTPKGPGRILLFITTIFSDRHIDFLSCCWPKLMENSGFLKSVDIIVFSNNETTIPSSTIEMTQQLFANNPSFRFQFAPEHELENIRTMSSAPNRFQMGANLPLQMGFSNDWFVDYDWVIRINPDVLIRNSTWLAKEAMIDESTDGIFVKCSEKPQRLHTDFFAFRPRAMMSPSQNPSNKDHSSQSLPFSNMVIQPYTKSLYNHEMTAYNEFRQIMEGNKAKFLPNIAPSNGFCRLRGEEAPVYHGHESCRKYDRNHNEQPQICDALEGWPIA